MRGAPGGLGLNHGSKLHLTSCWVLMLPLDEPRTLLNFGNTEGNKMRKVPDLRFDGIMEKTE